MSFTTNYRQAWLEYKKTICYKSNSMALKKAGIKQPYRDNILQAAFTAGWNATGMEIKPINQ